MNFTVFFCVIITYFISCKSLEEPEPEVTKVFLNSKYQIKYNLVTESYTDEYFRGIDVIFFPILPINYDGSLNGNYIQIASDDDFLILSSNQNLLSTVAKLADIFCKKLRMLNPPLICKMPYELNSDKKYLVKLYYYNNTKDQDINYLYIKANIELLDPSNKSQVSKVVWIGDGNFAYNKKLSLETLLDSGFKTLISYSFLKSNKTDSIYLLNN